jgi:hypothetical protein
LIDIFYVNQEDEELMEECQKIYTEELGEDVAMNDKVSLFFKFTYYFRSQNLL